MIDTSKAQQLDWPWLLGFHLNVAAPFITPEMGVARIAPTSPECVFMGDSGVPSVLHIPNEDGTFEAVDNSANAVPFSTGFFLFVDEAEARSLAPHLFVVEG